MGISLKGHDANWQYWVFDIDGRDWIAVNQSTPEPLNIRFQGRFGNWGTIPLSKEGGFDIISSTTSSTGELGQKSGIVEWVWNGVRYKSSWVLTAANEIVAGDPAEGIEAVWDYQLTFVGRVAYDGPTGGAVGTGVTSQATIEAAAQITPSAQLSTAAPEQQYPLPMSVASKPVTSGIATPTSIQAAQTGALTKDEREALEAGTTQIVPSAQLSTAAPQQASPAPAPISSAQTGISFLGHTPTYNQWVFNVSGKRLVAVNLSSQQPLQLKFAGSFSDQPLSLSNTSGFDITSSTGTTVEWVWQGKRYKSWWLLDAGDPAADEEATLTFGPPIPYEGPAGGAVGTGIVSQTTVQAAQSNKTKEDIEASTAYKTYGYTPPVAQQQTVTRTVYTPTTLGVTRSPVAAPGTKEAREAAAEAAAAAPATDWVKLGLQLGAAYLLLS